MGMGLEPSFCLIMNAIEWGHMVGSPSYMTCMCWNPFFLNFICMCWKPHFKNGNLKNGQTLRETSSFFGFQIVAFIILGLKNYIVMITLSYPRSNENRQMKKSLKTIIG